MMEELRTLLEQYDGKGSPIMVRTDLSVTKTPNFALSMKSEKPVAQDVLGGRQMHGVYSLQMRRTAAGEKDRRKAYSILAEIGGWLRMKERLGQIALEGGEAPVTQMTALAPVMQEAYDDGTAIWSMSIDLFWEENDN